MTPGAMSKGAFAARIGISYGRLAGLIDHGALTDAALTPDGKRIIVAEAERQLRTRPIDPAVSPQDTWSTAEFAARYGLSRRSVSRFFASDREVIRSAISDDGRIKELTGWLTVVYEGSPAMVAAALASGLRRVVDEIVGRRAAAGVAIWRDCRDRGFRNERSSLRRMGVLLDDLPDDIALIGRLAGCYQDSIDRVAEQRSKRKFAAAHHLELAAIRQPGAKLTEAQRRCALAWDRATIARVDAEACGEVVPDIPLPISRTRGG